MNDTLVVYFSGKDAKTSATADAARNLASVTGADLHEIKLQNPYSTDFATLVKEAQRDKDADARPALAGPAIDLTPYRTVILGFPNWCGTAPMPVFSFMDEHMKDGSLIGKRIIPFIINDGAGMQNSVDDLRTHYPELDIEDGEAFEHNKLDNASLKAIDWIEELM